MSTKITSPVDGSLVKEVQHPSTQEVTKAIELSHHAQVAWKNTPLHERIRIISDFVKHFDNDKEEIATELAWLIGRPHKYNFNEVRGFKERATAMIGMAEASLADVKVSEKSGFLRFIRKEPLGVIFVISAWNYPYLITVNSVVPALLAGNTVILKHAPQTFPCADRFAKAFALAGLPVGVFQVLHCDHEAAQLVIEHPLVNHVCFTGSVAGGRKVNQIASSKFINVGLELGGKDPAYVRDDADVINAAENLIDGAMYNSGQSCCGIDRVFVTEKLYDRFLDACVKVAYQYVLGPPFQESATMGPLVNKAAADAVRAHVQDAISKGAKALLDESKFNQSSVLKFKLVAFLFCMPSNIG